MLMLTATVALADKDTRLFVVAVKDNKGNWTHDTFWCAHLANIPNQFDSAEADKIKAAYDKELTATKKAAVINSQLNSYVGKTGSWSSCVNISKLKSANIVDFKYAIVENSVELQKQLDGWRKAK